MIASLDPPGASATSRGGRSHRLARPHLRLALFAVLFFCAVAPTLPWPQFSGDSEDNLVKTVLEIRNGGPWWVPTLLGVPRTRKPPLAAWASASAVQAGTMRQLNSLDPAVRERAYRKLALEVRWPALAAGAATVFMAGLLADALLARGRRHSSAGLIAAAVCATTLLFLRLERSATTDVWLALFTTATNYFLVLAIFHRKPYGGLIGAGICLGLALMSKGPPALVPTVAPVVAYAMVARRRARSKPVADAGSCRGWVGPIGVGCALTLAIALPWPISAALAHPQSLRAWWKELTAEGGQSTAEAHWWAYVSLIPNLLPWLPWMALGAWLGWRGRTRGRVGRRRLFATGLVVVPVLILSLFQDRKERYLLPLVPGAAAMATAAMMTPRRPTKVRRASDAAGMAALATIVTMAVGLPVAGWLFLRQENGGPWFSAALAMGGIAACAALLAAAWSWLRRSDLRGTYALAGCMLALNAMFMYGWSRSERGMSEMKPIADRVLAWSPAARVYYYEPIPHNKPVTMDLDIYLNATVPVTPEPPDPQKAKERGEAVAVVALQRELDGDPVPRLAGYRLLFDVVRRRHHWYVFVP
jgi:4-amino-4-deoxy-L-arabinose transferase-like glycosyltransferase